MILISLIVCALISYLMGSLNSAIIVVKLLKNEDIREHGSKNAGLTNTLRCYGKFPALLTLIGDLAKGVVAVLVSQAIMNAVSGGTYDLRFVGYFCGLFAVLGHIFPLYYGFKGGKGVLVCSSVLLVIDPPAFVIVIVFFAIVTAATKYVSVGSISAALFYVAMTFAMNYFMRHTALSAVLSYTICTALEAAVLIYMHRSNIQRLRNGTENKLGEKKKDS